MGRLMGPYSWDEAVVSKGEICHMSSVIFTISNERVTIVVYTTYTRIAL